MVQIHSPVLGICEFFKDSHRAFLGSNISNANIFTQIFRTTVVQNEVEKYVTMISSLRYSLQNVEVSKALYWHYVMRRSNSIFALEKLTV